VGGTSGTGPRIARRSSARGVLHKPVKTRDVLDQLFSRLRDLVSTPERRLLLVGSVALNAVGWFFYVASASARTGRSGTSGTSAVGGGAPGRPSPARPGGLVAAASPSQSGCSESLSTLTRELDGLRRAAQDRARPAALFRLAEPDRAATERFQDLLDQESSRLGLADGAAVTECRGIACRITITAGSGGSDALALDRVSGSPSLRARCSEISRGATRVTRDPVSSRPIMIADYFVKLRKDL